MVVLVLGIKPIALSMRDGRKLSASHVRRASDAVGSGGAAAECTALLKGGMKLDDGVFVVLCHYRCSQDVDERKRD